MNSILQCLSKDKTLRNYFCKKAYKTDVDYRAKLTNGMFNYFVLFNLLL
jgi:Ubiquitin C-terminal hydrolase